MADRDPQAHLRRISEALDGDGALPHPLDPEGAAFLDAATRLRSRMRVEAAATPPDVTDAVLERVRAEPKARPSPRPLSLVAAAVFVVAAVGAALAVRPGGPIAPEPVLADVGERVLQAQQDVLALDAAVTLVERGAHPEVPVRTYAGTLRYQAPERLWLHLVQDRTSLATGFPANDLDLVVDDGRAWSSGLRGCPVDAQPGCLGDSDARVVSGLAPFAADWVAPLDLVIPVDAFLPGAELAASATGGGVEITTTVARLQRTIDGLRAAGALRAVHATDAVRVELDRDTFTIRRLTVTAGDTAARVAWAASNGYSEPAGTAVLDLTLTEQSLPGSPFPTAPIAVERDAGFADRADPGGPAPTWLPTGFSAHRGGVQHGSGATTTVRSWSDGRAWIRVDVTTERAGDALVGGLGPIVRALEVGDGTGYTDPTGSVVSLHDDGIDAAVSGSVPLAVLVRVAASLPILGRELPEGWPQGEVLESLPEGALRPAGALIARYDGVDLLVALPGPGQTSAVLRQRPGTTLGPAAKADVSQVEVRGVAGRYEPRTQVVTWVEGGWIRELRSEGLDLAALLVIAEDLRP
ncbi:MAG: hypothetical protein ABIP36_06125 [Acidimicrobiales bacterium]